MGAAGLFLGFVALGLLTLSPSLRGRFGRRRLVHVFLGYFLAASCLPGLLQRDAWPFSSWKLIASRVTPTTRTAVGGFPVLVPLSGGQEQPTDFRAWEPLPFEELKAWLIDVFPRLSAGDKREAFSYLLARANRARQAALRTPRFAVVDRLGPLSAPYFVLHPRRWSREPPRRRFDGLRYYAELWDLEERARTGRPARRVLVYEYAER
ncbi:MAG TPA: hypothetical protein VFM29_02055 [Vicinamibacteria bacterium]|nr:hypothetical protein [Vicinamibacteria bacterium]